MQRAGRKEHQVSIFDLGDLRHTQGWVNNEWNHMKDRQDVASSVLSDIARKNRLALPNDKVVAIKASKTEAEVETLSTVHHSSEIGKGALVSNLDGWKWNLSRKRRQARESGEWSSRHVRQCVSGSSNREDVEAASDKFLPPKILMIADSHENCKAGGSDPMLVAPMALCSSLVMSRLGDHCSSSVHSRIPSKW